MEINYRDPLGRRFSSLRLSLTQACNFSCAYCVPENFALRASPNELSVDEFIKLARLIVNAAGIEKIRLTGGEPLLYRKFETLADALSGLGVNDMSLTTNGAALEKKVKVLTRNGFRRINVSMDAIDPDVFAKISRGGKIAKTLRGIEAALAEGIGMKINVVPMRSQNHDQILPMLDFCLERGIECRYIELMKMGHVFKIFEPNFVPMNEILNLIKRKYPVRPAHAPADSTAKRFEIPGKGFFGVIPNESEPFCKSCSRLRLSSTGEIYGCLSNSENFPVRNLLMLEEEDALEKLRGVLVKAMAGKQIQFQGSETYMQAIGG